MKNPVKVLILLFLLAGIMFFGKMFIDTDYFKVQEVLVEGKSDLLRQDITAQLEQMKGKNIIYLNTDEIENHIKKGDETLLADKDLKIYGDILEEPAKNIPIIDYTDDESLNAMKTILSKIKNKDFYAMISEIRQSEKNYEILLTNNVRIITETTVTEKKYEEAYRLYEKIRKKRPVISMDLRFIDKIVVK